MGFQKYENSVGEKENGKKEYFGQLIADEYTLLDRIHIGQRIDEIMKEKGKAFTISNVATRLGINRSTFANMLNPNHNREIYKYELDKILTILKVDHDRFYQEDMKANMIAFQTCMEENDYKSALSLAEEMVDQSIGFTEKSRAWNDLGRVHYYLKDYQKAHEAWLQGRHCAEQIQKYYGETEHLYKIMQNLMTSFAKRKEFSHALELIQKVGKVFQSDPERNGVMCHAHARLAYDSGCTAVYKAKMQEALECFRLTGKDRYIGKAEHNIAFIEYQLGNYEQSKVMFESAIQTLQNHREPRLISQKDYAKTLLKLGLHTEASEIISRSLEEIGGQELHELRAKFLVLKSMALHTAEFASEVITMHGVPVAIRSAACQFLMIFFSSMDDADSLLKYYRIEQNLLSSESANNFEEAI